MRGVKAFAGAAASALLLVCMGPMPVLADTIEAALVRAYQNNPQLNAQRAQVRVTDETVPQALSGYRPKVAVTASAGYQYTDTLSTQGGTATTLVKTNIHGANPPRSVGATITQTLFNGQQTANRTRVGGEPGFRRARSAAGHSNRPFCSAPPRSTWTICAIRRSSRCRRATFACSSRR